LEEETNQPCLIGVQAEGIRVCQVLRDVAREDCDEEEGRDQPNECNMTTKRSECDTEGDFHNAGRKNNEVGVQWQPGWNLSLKGFSAKGEVADARKD
jgi:hypothetical protein